MLLLSGAGDGGDEREAISAGEGLVGRLLDLATEGRGPWKGGVEVAEEALRAAGGSVEAAIKHLIRTHRILVGTTGAATGFPGLFWLPATAPTDLAVFYASAARLAVGIAHLRGYDVRSEHVRVVLAVTLLGAAGNELLVKAGVEVGKKVAFAQIKRLPGRILIEINKKVGFRLVTKFGEKGVVNLGKAVPFIGAGVGATVNVASISAIASFAKVAFPQCEEPASAPD